MGSLGTGSRTSHLQSVARGGEHTLEGEEYGNSPRKSGPQEKIKFVEFHEF